MRVLYEQTNIHLTPGGARQTPGQSGERHPLALLELGHHAGGRCRPLTSTNTLPQGGWCGQLAEVGGVMAYTNRPVGARTAPIEA